MTPQLSIFLDYDTLVVMIADVAWLDTEDGRLAYHDTGTGHPLVLLHGGLLDHHMWDDQIPVLAPLYRGIAPDTRGHGASANASRPFRHADDLAALLRHLDTGPAILAGVSMGAGIAVDTALEHPDLVRALIVSGAGTSEPEFTDPWTRNVLSSWASAIAAGDLESSIDAFALFAAGPHRAIGDVAPDVVRRIREMARTTMSKHAPGEPDWRLPVPDTWSRAATITVPCWPSTATSTQPITSAWPNDSPAPSPTATRPPSRRRALSQHGTTGRLLPIPHRLPAHPGHPAGLKSTRRLAVAGLICYRRLTKTGPDRPAGFPAEVCVTMRARLVPVSRLSSTSPRAAGISPP
jgi:pimeloyl-ACP methyl ester carboxylesterase